VLGEPGEGADLGEILGEHRFPNLRERKFAQPQPGAARTSTVATTPDHKEVTMKTQIRIASLALLAVLCLMLAVAPAMAQHTLYDNGPYNGTTNAWDINFGFSVSDSAKVANISRSNVKNNDIVYWDPSRTDVLTSVDTQFGTTPFGGSIQTSSGVNNIFLGTNQFGSSSSKLTPLC
jgi:hypothetical protein